MYSEPAFSVVIAVYNGAKTIRRAIESVLAQTYPAYELIVVDDGSIDETANEVARFGSALKYKYQTNSGVSAARNSGAVTARGDWLAFLDADDWYYPNRLRWHAEMVQGFGNLDFLTGNFDYRYPNGSLIRRSMESTKVGAHLLVKSCGENKVIMEEREMGEFIEQHFGDTHTLSLPRKTFLELGGYREELKVCEDVHLLIRLTARSRRVGVICEPMGVYIIHGNSATRSDPLRAQKQTVEALLSLRHELKNAAAPVRAGLDGALRRARLGLAYVLLGSGRRSEAMRAVIPLLGSQPGFTSLRNVLSIARGCMQISDVPRT